MRTAPDPVATLRDPEIKKFFMALLDSKASAEEKYQTFIRIFELEADLSRGIQGTVLAAGDNQAVDAVVAEAAQKVGAWHPEQILETTRVTLERALARIEKSRHADGGWGYQVQQSHPWATAWTVLCLHRAAKLAAAGDLSGLGDPEPLVEGGLRWLTDRRDRWSICAADIPAGQGRSVYETAVVLRCLYETGAAHRIGLTVEGCLDRLLAAQRPEGDWDSTLWCDEAPERPPSAREVGATSYALQALAASPRRDATVEKAALWALEWLRREQNPEGSWNGGIYPDHTPVPEPSVNKTCDGLKGFLAGRRLGIDLKPYQSRIDDAVKWLLHQEQALLDEEGKIKGWGWKDAADGPGQTLESKTEGDLLENTCLTLETLLDFESVGLPLLASNSLWLSRRQRRGGEDDGKWSNDDTGRIACGILDFFCRIKKSPLFQPAAERTAEPAGGGALPEQEGAA